MALSRVLLVDPQPFILETLHRILDDVADVHACMCFSEAREHLTLYGDYDRLVTNLRLQNYNGIHLAYLVGARTRTIVYTTRNEMFLKSEVQSAGAFYERYDRLLLAAGSYVRNQLPRSDRRLAWGERRTSAFRGGRRASDAITAHAVLSVSGGAAHG